MCLSICHVTFNKSDIFNKFDIFKFVHFHKFDSFQQFEARLIDTTVMSSLNVFLRNLVSPKADLVVPVSNTGLFIDSLRLINGTINAIHNFFYRHFWQFFGLNSLSSQDVGDT